MGLFGFGDDPSIPKAAMPEEYSVGFRRGQEMGFGDIESARGTGREQARLAEALRAQAEGRAPSLAAMQYARALEQSQAAGASQLASARGLSPAQAQQLLATQQAAARQGAAGQSAMMRLQEQQAAQIALANVLAQQRQLSLLGAQQAGVLGTQAGELGFRGQQLEQQRLTAEQQLLMDQQRRQEEAIAQGAGMLLGGALGGFAAPAGQVASGILGGVTKMAGGRAKGGEIKGHAKFKGDTRSNDTVPAMLSPGEIVLPRTVSQAEDAPDKARDFVAAIKKKKKPTPKDYMAALSRLEELESRLNAIETLQDLDAEERG
jgi:hypothetical protein